MSTVRNTEINIAFSHFPNTFYISFRQEAVKQWSRGFFSLLSAPVFSPVFRSVHMETSF